MQTMVPLYGFGGGPGGTGAALTVNAPAGCTVTVSKDGKTKTKTAGADGVAVFKGLATGTWTVTITDGEQEAQKTVTVTADYSTAITFFAATIHITYPAGSTCTATDGVTTLTAPNTSGTWDCVVPNAGTWTVRCTNGKYTANSTVSITSNGQNSTAKLSYDFVIFRNGTFENGFGLEQLSASNSPTPAKASVSNGLITMGGGGDRWGFKLNPSVDLTGYSAVWIKLAELYINNHATLMVGSDPKYGSSGDAKLAMENGTTQYRLDVSNINSKKYIFSETFNNAASTQPAVVKISEIILMR